MTPAERRGIRNNNPANIRHGNPWKGLKKNQTDPEFDQFTSTVWGVRALIITLRTYVTIHKLQTIRKIIERWAPRSDGNNTEGYIDFVRNYFKSHALNTDYIFSEVDFNNEIFGYPHHLEGLARAMCIMESNYKLSNEMFEAAFDLI